MHLQLCGWSIKHSNRSNKTSEYCVYGMAEVVAKDFIGPIHFSSDRISSVERYVEQKVCDCFGNSLICCAFL